MKFNWDYHFDKQKKSGMLVADYCHSIGKTTSQWYFHKARRKKFSRVDVKNDDLAPLKTIQEEDLPITPTRLPQLFEIKICSGSKEYLISGNHFDGKQLEKLFRAFT